MKTINKPKWLDWKLKALLLLITFILFLKLTSATVTWDYKTRIINITDYTPCNDLFKELQGNATIRDNCTNMNLTEFEDDGTGGEDKGIRKNMIAGNYSIVFVQCQIHLSEYAFLNCSKYQRINHSYGGGIYFDHNKNQSARIIIYNHSRLILHNFKLGQMLNKTSVPNFPHMINQTTVNIRNATQELVDVDIQAIRSNQTTDRTAPVITATTVQNTVNGLICLPNVTLIRVVSSNVNFQCPVVMTTQYNATDFMYKESAIALPFIFTPDSKRVTCYNPNYPYCFIGGFLEVFGELNQFKFYVPRGSIGFGFLMGMVINLTDMDSESRWYLPVAGASAIWDIRLKYTQQYNFTSNGEDAIPINIQCDQNESMAVTGESYVGNNDNQYSATGVTYFERAFTTQRNTEVGVKNAKVKCNFTSDNYYNITNFTLDISKVHSGQLAFINNSAVTTTTTNILNTEYCSTLLGWHPINARNISYMTTIWGVGTTPFWRYD